MINFDKFFDGESLKQEDIVVWLNLGTQEVCEAETSTTGPNVDDYVGDVVIRKFPYDPVDWYFETDSIE